MKNETIAMERKRLQDIANEYTSKGYRVLRDVGEFPSFLQDFKPDLVAMSLEDNVIIEIVSKETIKDKDRLRYLAETVNNKNKWRFEVVVTNPKNTKRLFISDDEINIRISQGNKLLKQGLNIPALLILWSTVEPLLRMNAVVNNIKIENITPIKFVKTMYTLGFLSMSDYEVLSAAAKIRNDSIHGYQLDQNINLIDIVTELYAFLINFVNRRNIGSSTKKKSKKYKTNELVDWFFNHYEDPANGVPYESKEGGYIYINGGPYDAWEELTSEYPDADDKVLNDAVSIITNKGIEWIKIGQY